MGSQQQRQLPGATAFRLAGGCWPSPKGIK
jgi:hypothetical protein